jgi:hypothetical protein
MNQLQRSTVIILLRGLNEVMLIAGTPLVIETPILALVHRDSTEPRIESRLMSKSRKRTPSRHEHVLRHLFRHQRLTQPSQAQAVDAVLISLDQVTKGMTITALTQRDELFIGGRGSYRGDGEHDGGNSVRRH